MGITEALFVPAALSVIGTVHPGPTRSRALALYSTGQMTGIVAGGWCGGWFAGAWGWRTGFVVLAVSGIVFAPIFRALLGNIPRAELPARAAPAWSGLFSSRCYWSLAAAFFMLCALLWMFYAWLPDFIYEHYRLTLSQSGWIATAYMQAGTVTGLLVGGWLGDRLAAHVPPARFYIAGCGLVLAAPFAWLAFSGAPLGAVKCSAALFGIFSGFMIANVFASAYDVIPVRTYGFGGGALNMIGGLAGGAAMFAAGTWRSSFGPQGLMKWSSAAAGAAAIVLLLVAARRFRADRLLLTRQ
jgi:MFS family permease